MKNGPSTTKNLHPFYQRHGQPTHSTLIIGIVLLFVEVATRPSGLHFTRRPCNSINCLRSKKYTLKRSISFTYQKGRSSCLKAFLFDLDGVITDTAEFHYHAWKKLGNEIGISIDRVFQRTIERCKP